MLTSFIFWVCCCRLFNNFINNCVFVGALVSYFIMCILLVFFEDKDHKFSKNIEKFLFAIAIIFLLVACFIFNKGFNEHKHIEVFLLFAFLFIVFILFETAMVIISCDFDTSATSYKNTNNFFNYIRLVLIAFFVLFFIILGLGGSRIYKEFLKSINLASDHVEIYLKDKNESINGELIFDDGKYAYVKFNRTVSNCGDVSDSCIKTIRKKVPSEDVSIITRVKKDTKASVPK